MMTNKTSRPALVTFLLLFSTLHLLFWPSSSLALSDSSSSLNKDPAKADKASLTKGESHVQLDPKFQELIDKYRATITALERTIDGILPVIVGANITLTIKVNLLLSLGVPIERADELETKWKRVWDKWCAIATDDFGPGLLTVAKKAFKDFERVPSQASQSAFEASAKALEAAVAPLEPILKGQPLWNFDRLLEHRDMTLYAAVYQDAVDAFIKVLDCEPGAEEAVDKVLQHLREVNLYRSEVTLSPSAKFKKWLPVIKWGTFGLAISIAAVHIFNAIYGDRTTDTTSDIYQTIESITSDDHDHSTDAPMIIYTDHITETIDDYGRTVVVALVICVVLLVATGVGLYYFLFNSNRKMTKDTNLEATKSTKCSSSSSNSPAGGTSSKPYRKRS